MPSTQVRFPVPSTFLNSDSLLSSFRRILNLHFPLSNRHSGHLEFFEASFTLCLYSERDRQHRRVARHRSGRSWSIPSQKMSQFPQMIRSLPYFHFFLSQKAHIYSQKNLETAVVPLQSTFSLPSSAQLNRKSKPKSKFRIRPSWPKFHFRSSASTVICDADTPIPNGEVGFVPGHLLYSDFNSSYRRIMKPHLHPFSPLSDYPDLFTSALRRRNLVCSSRLHIN